MWSLIEKLPNAEEYNMLRETTDWGTYAEDFIQQYLANSLFCVCAMAGDNCVGMARVVGDGGLVFYIQDVIVVPEYQSRGIGTQMVAAVMRYIRSIAVQNTMIGLMAAKGKESFYEKSGFVTRPNGKYGAGMTLFWQESS